MRWITVTHTQRCHDYRHSSSGTGPVYQGRFKSFEVETDEHFLTVARYVERNALRAKLVQSRCVISRSSCPDKNFAVDSFKPKLFV
jgi:hypothetical protein